MRASTLLAIAIGIAMPSLATAEPYVSAQLGYARVDWPRGSPLNGRIDDRGLAYGADLGFRFNRRWAVEVGAYGYDDFGARGTPCTANTACSPVVTEVNGNDVSILKAALSPQFDVGTVRLFATFGYYRANIDTNLALPNAETRDRGAVLGVGARWYFADPWSVSLQATRFDDNLQQLMFGVGWGLRRDRNDNN